MKANSFYYYHILLFQVQGLSPQTFTATIQTCGSMPQLIRYLIDERGFNYIQMGRIQSDCIESRFGWIRALNEGNYFISMRQLLEGEQKIKTISINFNFEFQFHYSSFPDCLCKKLKMDMKRKTSFQIHWKELQRLLPS